MAAGQAQLTDLPGGVVTRPGADQDGLTQPGRTQRARAQQARTQRARTQPARTRPADRTTAVLPLPGAGLAYQVTGDGPAVVLVHGFGLDMRMWEPQVEHLAARYRVVRYDCRGFGASGPFDPAVPYTHAGDLVALLDHLAIDQAVLAGLSFGGRVVLQTALAAPARVAGLVLLDAVLDGVPWDPESAGALDELARQVQAGGVRAGRAAWLAHPLFAAARQRPELAVQLAAMVAGYPGQHWLGRDPHRPAQPPPIEALADVATPALVVVGHRDVPGFREMSAVLARRIPGAGYRVVAGAGHMVNMEQPAAVNGLLTRFLAGLPAPATEGLSEQTEELTEQGDEQWSR
jgi:3-oxoadipate enol-lactonase